MIDPNAIERVLSHILPAVDGFQQQRAAGNVSGPFVLGLSGLQGSGKSTWAAALVRVLTEKHKLNTYTLSLDDLYLDHEHLVAVRTENADNALLQTRGQPGTHDEVLAEEVFKSFRIGNQDIYLPAFDKSKFNGEGDRVPCKEWQCISASTPVDVLIFEGWCLGFQPLSERQVEEKWQVAKQSARESPVNKDRLTGSTNTLPRHRLEHLLTINSNLHRYCETFTGPQFFDSFIHLDTDQLQNVYQWRLGQEHMMIKVKGRGMTDEAVIRFVEGYMPAYELYLERLQRTRFCKTSTISPPGNHVRVVLDTDRVVINVDTV